MRKSVFEHSVMEYYPSDRLQFFFPSDESLTFSMDGHSEIAHAIHKCRTLLASMHTCNRTISSYCLNHSVKKIIDITFVYYFTSYFTSIAVSVYSHP